ncbi:hypothetical protein [Leptothoe spongobia]|nr:hypothetical protein [Leptothoe spongobia]
MTIFTSWAIPHKTRLNGLMGGLMITLVSCQTPPPINDEDLAAPATPTAPTERLSVPNGGVSDNGPPPPPANSYLAQLPPDATNQLVSLAINIAIPTYLPADMTLANYGIGETATGRPYYWLVYRDNQDRCFAIEYSATGIGDISLENKEPLDHALFGKDYSLYHGKFPNGGAGELPESDLFTDWLEGDDGFYRLVGAGLVNTHDYGQSNCSNISVKEAIAVTESLSYLPTDIRTLDLVPTKPDP